MKKGLIWAIVLVAAIIFGMILVIVQCSADEAFIQNVKLDVNGIVREELDFSAGLLKPNDSCKYKIIVKPSMEGNYVISFEFEEEHDGGLSRFIDVSISYEDTVVETTLAELFAGKEVSFEGKLTMRKPAEIQVVFTMQDVGNEAQGTSTDFSAYLTATRN